MADWHLRELREALQKRGWLIVAQHQGDDYRISASWEIHRSGRSNALLIDFDGLDDMVTLPLDQAFGCSIRDHRRASLYFTCKGEKHSLRRSNWKTELVRFVDALEVIVAD